MGSIALLEVPKERLIKELTLRGIQEVRACYRYRKIDSNFSNASLVITALDRKEDVIVRCIPYSTVYLHWTKNPEEVAKMKEEAYAYLKELEKEIPVEEGEWIVEG